MIIFTVWLNTSSIIPIQILEGCPCCSEKNEDWDWSTHEDSEHLTKIFNAPFRISTCFKCLKNKVNHSHTITPSRTICLQYSYDRMHKSTLHISFHNAYCFNLILVQYVLTIISCVSTKPIWIHDICPMCYDETLWLTSIQRYFRVTI